MSRFILLLSSARMNGTIILRSLGQLENTIISNEYTTYMNFGGLYRHWDDSHSEHSQKVVELLQKVKEAQDQGKTFIEHSMAGDLNDEEMSFIRTRMSLNVLIVAVVRQPEKQFLSLKKLPTAHSNPDEFRWNLINQGWLSLEHFHRRGDIDLVVDSEKWLVDENYRREMTNLMGLEYQETMAKNMTRYLGPAFHEICEITRKWGDNPWNGTAAKSTELHPDTSPMAKPEDLTERERVFLPQARRIYQRMLAKR